MMASLYAVPLPSHQRHHQSSVSRRKRKRRPSPAEDEARFARSGSLSDQYTAVLSPQERVQRDLANYSLVADLPLNPFPHRAPNSGRERLLLGGRHARTTHPKTCSSGDARHSSLKAQHVAAMTAVLHRCMQHRDYARASRALGLLLRTDVGGRPIDIRAAGYWSMAAEILLCGGAGGNAHSPQSDQHKPFTPRGFSAAKAFYETLIIQHPFHKPSPDSISALDFYLALFSLWIYVAQAEAVQQQAALDADQDTDPSLDYLSQLQQATRVELRQANEIADRMERCMSSAPFSSNQDLVRMRAMVARWQSGLNDALDDGGSVVGGGLAGDGDDGGAAAGVAGLQLGGDLDSYDYLY
ncbi:hypothetical protein DV735_g4553, partial [Chaetothyriales sp. CBS 134920]